MGEWIFNVRFEGNHFSREIFNFLLAADDIISSLAKFRVVSFYNF